MFTTPWDTSLTLLQWGVVIGASAAAAIWDVREHRIPNILTLPLFVGGLVWSSWRGGLAGVGQSLIACVILAGPYVWLFLVAGGGAGDAKMMGAIGLWLGLANGLATLVCVSIAGVLLGVVSLVRQRGFSAVWSALVIGLGELFQRFSGSGGAKATQDDAAVKPEPLAKMPYGLAICFGVCLAAIGVKLWKMQA
ncbi:MAG: prepilin peptidase [Phycisphaerales bacterium]|jgi:Flp pilus assembly protein protease CpaA|nr:prepilin peptidase [Phycisphaerales bacterium]